MRNDVSDESFFFHLETDPEKMNNLFPSGLEAETRLQNDLIQWIETSPRARSELVPFRQPEHPAAGRRGRLGSRRRSDAPQDWASCSSQPTDSS